MYEHIHAVLRMYDAVAVHQVLHGYSSTRVVVSSTGC